MSEKDIQLLVMCLKEYIKNIDGERFKQLFLGYAEYMARNYGQDCLIDEYDLMMEQVEKFVDEQHLDINLLPPYKRDVFYRFIKNHYSKQDILSLYYFNDEIAFSMSANTSSMSWLPWISKPTASAQRY